MLMRYACDRITQRIIACIIKVHQILGPGFKESIYRNSLLIELEKNNLCSETELEFLVFYDDREVGKHRLDLVVERTVVVELKTVDHLTRAHYAQLRSYLKATCFSVGILVNFATEKADFRRLDKGIVR